MQPLNSDLSGGSVVPPEANDHASDKKSGLYTFLRRGVIFILVCLYFGAFAPLGVDFHHDGVMFIPALRVASGEMVFRDVFCQYGFLSPVLQGFSLWLGGNELLVMKYFSVLFYAGSAVLLDIIWQRFISLRWRNFLMLMYFALMPDSLVTFHPWSSIFALFFSLAAIEFMLSYLSGRKKIRLFCAGMFAGITFLARHPVGVVTLLSILISLFFDIMLSKTETRNWKDFAWKNLIAFAGFLLITGAVAILLILTGAWDDFVLQCVTYVFNFVHGRGGNGSWNYFAASLMPFITDNLFADSIFAILPLFPLYWMFKATRSAIVDRSAKNYWCMLVTLTVFAFGSWHQYYPVPCVRHLFWGGVPFFGFFIMSINSLWHHQGERAKLAKILALLCLLNFAFCASFRVVSGYRRLAGASKRQVSSLPGLRGMKYSKGEAAVISYFRNCLDQLPEDIRKRGVLNYTPNALWSVILPDAGFRHPQFLHMGNALYRDYDEKIIQFIRSNRPAVLSIHPIYLENYWPAGRCEYMGEAYTLWAPSN